MLFPAMRTVGGAHLPDHTTWNLSQNFFLSLCAYEWPAICIWEPCHNSFRKRFVKHQVLRTALNRSLMWIWIKQPFHPPILGTLIFFFLPGRIWATMKNSPSEWNLGQLGYFAARTFGSTVQIITIAVQFSLWLNGFGRTQWKIIISWPAYFSPQPINSQSSPGLCKYSAMDEVENTIISLCRKWLGFTPVVGGSKAQLLSCVISG